ncbi:hypothetical protein GKZ90_0010265 [Flavobacterium sp. MC2016-06]|uniref:hypothetical protein n=1 Tax=Flavobacterium sp. MC2016-06 TaxID=2676308 RepID=UPI0012BA696C|nr:hypothetical protein [Flavobacterium sp. MC2016-06]MBU3858483.1 hypothetical protein [Flavobacterium sp. MC2016-06]
MKKFFLILITFIILSCNDKPISLKNLDKTHSETENQVDKTEYENHEEIHEEMDKVSKELDKFNEQLIKLYSDSKKNPEKVLAKTDSLLSVNKNEKSKYKSQIKSNIEDGLHDLKAEIFYKIGKYNESITELNYTKYRHGETAVKYAANYIKLKNYEKAKSFIDSIGGFYINDYATANYYESIKNKPEALKIYTIIKKDKSIKHYAYYKLAVERFEELNKKNPKLLNEIYFPTGDPSFEVCDSDNINRSKIFKLMEELPENQEWAGTSILESPQINDKNYYLVRVYTKEKKEFNYLVYQKTFEIKFLDPKTKKLLTLTEWRETK